MGETTIGTWEKLLIELEEQHPIKGMKPGDLVLLFGGWDFGQAMLLRKAIILPKKWLKTPVVMEYAIVHEYAHFYREKMGKRKWSLFTHDKEMKRLETQFLNDIGVRISRWLRYPREIRSVRYGQWHPFEQPHTLLHFAYDSMRWNQLGLFVALIISYLSNMPDRNFKAGVNFLITLWLLSRSIYQLTNLVQNLVWVKHRLGCRQSKRMQDR